MKKLSLLAVFLCLAVNAFAADEFVSFREMDVNIGARSQGMGNAYTAAADDSSSVFWNPAGLARVKKAQAAVSYNSWFVDTSIQYATGAMSTGKNSSAGAGIIFVNMGEIEFIDDDGWLSGDVLRPFSLILAGGYGVKVFDYYGDVMRTVPDHSVSLGISAKTILNHDGYDGSFGVFMDTGLLVEIGNMISAGVNFRNLGVVSYGSAPVGIRAGACVKAYDDGIHAALLAAEAGYNLDEIVELSAGLEYSFAAAFFARAGYEWQSNYETSEGTVSGISAGIGVKLSQLFLDYSASFNGGLGATHILGIRMIFDPVK